jgi:hemolysin activation/secretion protein
MFDPQPSRDSHRVSTRQRARGGLLALALAAALAPGAAPAQGPAETAPRAATPTASVPTFAVRAYVIEGNRLLDPVSIEMVLAPWTGSNRTFADIQAAAAALQDSYARAGWAAVQVTVPEQAIDAGRVRLAVLEPRLRSVVVEGQQHQSAEHLRQALPSLREGSTPNTAALGREIRLANDNPARRISVDLRSEAAGTLDALVAVHDEKPWKVGVVADDTGTPETGAGRIGIFFQHANVADLDHVATLQYITSPENASNVGIGAVNYRVPLPALGDALDLFAVHADVDSGVVGNLFEVRGRGTVVGLRYQHNFAPTANLQHRALVGLEHHRVDNRVGTVGTAPELVPDIVLRPASVGYSASWSNAEGRLVDGSATLVANIPGADGGRAEDFAAARTGATPNYTLLRYAASLLQPLGADWALRVALDGQYTRDALVSAEQFGVGGADSVRGFFERQVINDRGHRTTFEVQTPNFGAYVGPHVAARYIGFVDTGWVRRNHALPGEAAQVNISSIGVGFRASVAPAWSLRLDFAHVLQGGGVRPRGDERLHFSLGYVR